MRGILPHGHEQTKTKDWRADVPEAVPEGETYAKKATTTAARSRRPVAASAVLEKSQLNR
jgi:hypothetical protein